MRALILFSAMFQEWPLAIVRELSRRDPSAAFTGIVVGKERVYHKVRRQSHPPVDPLYKLYELEQEWLKTPVVEGQLAKYEAILTPDVLNRMVAASRQIGCGWVLGGRMAQTRLMQLSRDTEMIRRYVVGLLNFLFRLFAEQRPDVVFCYVVADAPAFGLSKVCRHFGVPFRRLTHARIGAKCIVDNTPEGLLGPVARTYQRALQDPIELNGFIPEARTYLREFRSAPSRPEYQLAADRVENRNRSLLRLPGQIGNVLLAFSKIPVPQPAWHEPTNWYRRCWQLSVNLQSLLLSVKSPFRRIGDLPRGPFAYFPLHIDPEESTMVYSPFQTNQVAIIEALTKSLPLGMDLVVKEHWGMVGRRPRGFYTTLKRMPKVILTSPFESTFDLIQRAALTCGITGTATWEAVLLKKPALVLGETFAFLSVGQGMVHCVEPCRLAAAIVSALELPPATEDRLELYIASILYHSFDFPADLFWGKVSHDQVEKNNEILDRICTSLTSAAEGED